MAASYLGITSPVPYEGRKVVTKSSLESGMNFAYGGTGVFNTMVNSPNMSGQISDFQQLLEQKWYTKQDLNASIALVSLAGNDYGAYLHNHDTNPKVSSLAKLFSNLCMYIITYIVLLSDYLMVGYLPLFDFKIPEIRFVFLFSVFYFFLIRGGFCKSASRIE